LGWPNAVDVVFPKDEVAPNVDCGFVELSRDPRENADAGMAPNGDDPNDVAGLLNADVPEVPPKVDVELPNAL
jgi:hypothetical protein